MESAENKPGLSRQCIKYLAAACMLLNHISHTFFIHGWIDSVLIAVGSFTMPVMVYFLWEGWGYTRSRRNYCLRLLLFAVISAVPFVLMIGIWELDFLFTLLLCAAMAVCKERISSPALQFLCYFALIWLSRYCDWSLEAPLLMLLLLYHQEWELPKFVPFGLTFLVYVLELCLSYGAPLRYALLCSVGILAAGAVICLLFSGQRGRYGSAGKWFFYVFYPAHILLLVLLRRLLYGYWR